MYSRIENTYQLIFVRGVSDIPSPSIHLSTHHPALCLNQITPVSTQCTAWLATPASNVVRPVPLQSPMCSLPVAEHCPRQVRDKRILHEMARRMRSGRNHSWPHGDHNWPGVHGLYYEGDPTVGVETELLAWTLEVDYTQVGVGSGFHDGFEYGELCVFVLFTYTYRYQIKMAR